MCEKDQRTPRPRSRSDSMTRNKIFFCELAAYVPFTYLIGARALDLKAFRRSGAADHPGTVEFLKGEANILHNWLFLIVQFHLGRNDRARIGLFRTDRDVNGG